MASGTLPKRKVDTIQQMGVCVIQLYIPNYCLLQLAPAIDQCHLCRQRRSRVCAPPHLPTELTPAKVSVQFQTPPKPRDAVALPTDRHEALFVSLTMVCAAHVLALRDASRIMRSMAFNYFVPSMLHYEVPPHPLPPSLLPSPHVGIVLTLLEASAGCMLVVLALQRLSKSHTPFGTAELRGSAAVGDADHLIGRVVGHSLCINQHILSTPVIISVPPALLVVHNHMLACQKQIYAWRMTGCLWI